MTLKDCKKRGKKLVKRQQIRIKKVLPRLQKKAGRLDDELKIGDVRYMT